jgi:proteasome alpha subunit
VGKFSEFDSLRTQGVRLADLKGYTYSREDVDARSLANAYAQALGNVFTHEMKPMEVEILVAEVGTDKETDQLFRISYEGTIVDEDGSTVLGGDADTVGERLRANLTGDLDLGGAVRAAVSALAGPERVLEAQNLEVTVLSRTTARRAFRRIVEEELTSLLGQA